MLVPLSTNATIGWPVYRDFETLEPDGTFTATTEDPEYPASQLGRLPIHHVWRSAAVTPGDPVPDEELVVTFDRDVELGTVAIVRHNLSGAGTYRVRLYADVARTVLLWDSNTQPMWPTVYADGQVPWEDDNWWELTYTERERRGQTWHQRLFVPELFYGRAVVVNLSDPTNENGYMQVGLLEVAGKRQFTVNFAPGADHGMRGRSEVEEARGGTKYRLRLPKPRVFEGRIAFAVEDEALGVFFELLRQNDINVPFFWSPNPENARHYLRTDYMAHNSKLGLLGYATDDGKRHSVPLSLEEEM